MIEAVIFDMDGVIVDNNQYHVLSWGSFFEKYNKKLDERDLKKWIFGRTNVETIKHVFGEGISEEDIYRLVGEKEELYRQIYLKKITQTKGLIDFLKNLKSQNIKIGLGTSAPRENVNFVLDTLDIRRYFDIIIDAEIVKRGKPYPDVYLAVARGLGVNTSKCVVFEDSISGIEAACNAGMFVIGVTTTLKNHEMEKAQYFVNDFEDLNFDKIRTIVSGCKKFQGLT
jgi:beta-phosphoglucomutase family hydrolase